MFLELIAAVVVAQTQQSPWSIDFLSPPKGELLEVGGMGFMSDGDMVVSTRRGQVWRIDNPSATNPEDATFTLICEGLHEGMGLAVVDDEIFVAQRGELSKLLDLDGDERIDEIQTITQDWGMSGNYHEFGFGLPVDKDGNMYVSLNVGFWNPHWWHGKSRAPYRGWVLKISPEGIVTPLAGGLRSPAGMGLLEDGTLLVTDNQGDWMPVCPVYEIKEGGFYGHPASLRWYADQPDDEPSDTQPPSPEVKKREHPVLWLPYQWSRSTGNVIRDDTGGPFHGQYMIAELTNGQILRANFEMIDGVRQGACWLAHKRVGSAYHIEYGPDGTLYAGITNRGWGGLAPGSGIARITYSGKMPLEMKTGHLLTDGFEISFTKPLVGSPTVTGEKYDYNWWWEYGSPIKNLEELNIEDVTLSNDGLTAKVTISNLEAGKCVMLKVEHATSTDGSPLLHDEMSYTINKMPGGALEYVAKQAEPPVERGEEVNGWLYLTWGDAFDIWTNDGVIACNAELDINNPTEFIVEEGPGALVARAGNSMRTNFSVEQGTVHIKYMLAEEAVAEIQLPNGGSIVLSNEDEGGYLGSGIWHELVAKFSSDPNVIHTVDVNSVRMATDVPVTDRIATPLPLTIRSLVGDIAFGDVRLQHHAKEVAIGNWYPLKYDANSFSAIDGHVEVISNDGDLIVKGEGTVVIPVTILGNQAVRFEVKQIGTGLATIAFGELAVDVAAWHDRKTGGLHGHPINVNLIDQNEWCTIEILQDDVTTVRINGVPVLTVSDVPAIGNDITVTTDANTEVHIRQAYVQKIN